MILVVSLLKKKIRLENLENGYYLKEVSSSLFISIESPSRKRNDYIIEIVWRNYIHQHLEDIHPLVLKRTNSVKKKYKSFVTYGEFPLVFRYEGDDSIISDSESTNNNQMLNRTFLFFRTGILIFLYHHWSSLMKINTLKKMIFFSDY